MFPWFRRHSIRDVGSTGQHAHEVGVALGTACHGDTDLSLRPRQQDGDWKGRGKRLPASLLSSSQGRVSVEGRASMCLPLFVGFVLAGYWAKPGNLEKETLTRAAFRITLPR